VAYEFEFDEIKSQVNLKKHGIDFLAAQALWLDDHLIEVPARTEGEPRFLVVGVIADRHWSAIVTCRGERIRLVSVRRARATEVAVYEDG